MILLGIDLETTGLDTSSCEIIEVGAVLWDTGTHQIVRTYSTLVKNQQPIPEDVQKLTGITQGLVDRFGTSWSTVLTFLNRLQGECDYLVGHNAKGYDAEILARMGMEFGRPWIDTTQDVPYPAEIKTRKLTHLAAEHRFVNPFPHRAVTDVLTTLQILSFYQPEEIERYAKADSKTVVAQFERSDPEFESKKEVVKRNRYRWTGAPEYQWRKTLKDFQVEEECVLLAKDGIIVSTLNT